jgi:hypothetical protein
LLTYSCQNSVVGRVLSCALIPIANVFLVYVDMSQAVGTLAVANATADSHVIEVGGPRLVESVDGAFPKDGFATRNNPKTKTYQQWRYAR